MKSNANDIKEQIKKLAGKYSSDLVEYRRHIHSNPELAFEEHETSAFIADKLKKMNIPFEKGVAKTGIVGLIRGKDPDKKIIALRADMDALPIHEKNDVPYKSKNEGKMHACGHDVHTTCLLGAARILNDLKENIEGTVKLIFQPSEEKLPGGAKVMIGEGVLQNPEVQSIVGEHVYPELETGKVGFRPGKYMASTDEIYLKVIGKGGHAALPYNNIDPVLITSHIIVALQQVVSRHARPDVPSVLSFGRLTADGATNIIPDEVHVEGTFRTFDEEWRGKAHEKIRSIAEGVAKSMGGECEIAIEKGYPYLKNDEEMTRYCKKWAKEFLGEENVIDLDMRMTAEDFAYFSQKVPAVFYRLGTRNEAKGITSFLHTATFDIDESALETGAGLMAWLAFKKLSA